jgi:hypothetical protein
MPAGRSSLHRARQGLGSPVRDECAMHRAFLGRCWKSCYFPMQKRMIACNCLYLHDLIVTERSLGLRLGTCQASVFKIFLDNSNR